MAEQQQPSDEVRCVRDPRAPLNDGKVSDLERARGAGGVGRPGTQASLPSPWVRISCVVVILE